MLALAAPAWAADPAKIANDFVAAMQASGATATYDAATAAGADVSITGLKLTLEDEGTFEISTVLIINPVDRAAGGFTADRISTGSGKMEAEGQTFGWAQSEMTTVTVPSPAEIADNPTMAPFTSMAVEGISLNVEDVAETIPIDRFDMSIGNLVDGTPQQVAFHVTGVGLPESVVYSMDDDFAQLLQQLEIGSVVLSVGLDAGYQRDIDTIDVRSLSFELGELGKIVIATQMGGFPLSTLQSADGAEKVLATAKLNSLSFRFENQGIVQKVLDMQAAQTGLTRDQLVSQLTGAMPFMLGFLGDPALQQSLATALSAFLIAPNSITITANPSTPVPFADLMQAGENPTAIIGKLGLSATAND